MGALKGAPCTIRKTEITDAGLKVIFEWQDTSGTLHTTETTIPAGPQGPRGPRGPQGSEMTDEEIIRSFIAGNVLYAVASDGTILTDENNNILMM